MNTNFKTIDGFFYDQTTPLGKGSFGTVFKATYEKTNQPFAVKVIPCGKLASNELDYNLFMREVNVLREIKGEHIVTLKELKRTTNNVYIFIDYCDGGDLEKQMKKKRYFTEEESLIILKQIAKAFVAIEDLHIKNSEGEAVTVMHRDIKPANILFHEGKVKVADFGFAKFIDEANKDTKHAGTILGTPLYMPPQILNNERYSIKCDIWSTGVMIYELLFGDLPWMGRSVPDLYRNIKLKPLVFPKPIRPETKDLIIKMLKVNEEERISWKEVLAHPALGGIGIEKESSPNQIPEQIPSGLVQPQHGRGYSPPRQNDPKFQRKNQKGGVLGFLFKRKNK